MPKPFVIFGIVMGIITFFSAAYAEGWTLPSVDIDVMGFLTIGLMLFGFHIVLKALNMINKNQHKIMKRINELDDK